MMTDNYEHDDDQPDTETGGYPFPKGLAPYRDNPSAADLQRLLIAADYLRDSDGGLPTENYGPRTRAAVRAFHAAHPEIRHTDGARITPTGWRVLVAEALR